MPFFALKSCIKRLFFVQFQKHTEGLLKNIVKINKSAKNMHKNQFLNRFKFVQSYKHQKSILTI